MPSALKTLKISLALVVGFYLVNFGIFGFLIGPFDYDHLSGYYDLAWRFWQTSPGLPHFNPYLCGGRTLGADPQIPIFHPLVLLVPLLGPTWLIKMEMLVQLSLGSWGLWKWLERWKCDHSQLLWAIFVYLAGGGVVSRFLVGHVTLGFYLLLPLFFYLSYRLEEESSRSLILGYWFLFLYSGLYKPNFLIYLVPPLLFETALRSFLKKRPSILLHFLVALGVSSIANALTHLPAMVYFSQFPRRQDGLTSFFIPLYTLLANLLLPLKTIPKSWYGNTRFLQRHEYNYFVGPLALYFAYKGIRALGLQKPASLYRAEKLSLLMFAGLSFWLGLGATDDNLSVWLPFTWIRPLWPGFSSIRVPPRFWFGGFLALIVFSSQAFQLPRSRSTYLSFLFLGIFPLIGISGVNLFKTTLLVHYTQWVSPRLFPDELLLTKGNVNEAYKPLREGRAVMECVANLALDPNPFLKEADTLEVESSSPVDTKLKWVNWSTIDVSATTKTPTPFTLSLNLNPSPYWSFLGNGRVVFNRNSSLTVLSEGAQLRGQLSFRQPWVVEAFWISLAGWIIIILFGFLPKNWLGY